MPSSWNLKVIKQKKVQWPWHVLTVLVLIGLAGALYYATSLMSYEWRWNRVPQYFAYQAEEAQRAAEHATIIELVRKGDSAEVVLRGEDGNEQRVTVAGNSLQLAEGDEVDEGDVIGVNRHWAAGPLLWGLWTTVWLSLVSGVLGLIIGLATGLCRLSNNPTLRDLSTLYVELVRGTPLLVQIFIFYFFIGTVLNLSREFAGIAIKQLFTGVYLAELCMIGLLGASAQPGPLILMVAFLPPVDLSSATPSESTRSTPLAGFSLLLAGPASTHPSAMHPPVETQSPGRG